MNYVIIGNSAAAVGCIEGIRSVDRTGSITVISDEPHHTYGRPLISYLLQGKTDREHIKYRGDSFYEDNGCKVVLGEKAVSIDTEHKSVALEDGQIIPYDKLLIATGSAPFVPQMEGIQHVERKFTFMSLDDALCLESALTGESRVMIIGAGLIGLKCAEGIYEKVKAITVVDLADRVLSSILPAESAAIVQSHLESKGITFALGDSVSLFEDEKTAILKSGRAITFDVLVVAVGVRPNVRLAADAGINVNRGIQIKASGETNITDVYAAGDCCESYDITSGENKILALLPNAYLQGEAAGINMAGGERCFDKAMPLNAIGFMGLHIMTAGTYSTVAYKMKSEAEYKILFAEDNLLKGFILIGENLKGAGIYTALIRNKVPLDELDFEMICEKPQFMAFAADVRRQMFGHIAPDEEGYLL